MSEKQAPQEFEDCFEFQYISKNTSSHGYIWRNTCGDIQNRYMTKTHMENLLLKAVINRGRVKGKWTTKSQGGVKSLSLLEAYPLDCEKCEFKIQCALKGVNRE